MKTHPSEWKKNRAAWVQALRTRSHGGQCRHLLHDSNGNHCCLGVLEVLAVEAGCKSATSNGIEVAGAEACGWVGLRWADGEYAHDCFLVTHNDDDRWSFDEIADLIESEPPGLFHPIPDSEDAIDDEVTE